MNRFVRSFLAAALVAALGTPVLAADRIRLVEGAQASRQASGTIAEISPTELVIVAGESRKAFPVNEVEAVTFDGEPSELTKARAAAQAGRLGEAAESLAKVKRGALKRKEIVAEYDFYKAYVAARLALAGSGSIADAGRQLVGFEKANPTSFHYFEACETLGDLLSAVNRADQAEVYYGKVAAAPWPEYKLRAGVLVGRALLGQKQFDRAIARFDEVLAAGGTGDAVDRQKLAATLGKAAATAGAGKTEEAVQAVEEVIAKADPENQELHARAYNILGNCYLTANKKKEALLAFLHVDLLYSRFPEQHAEALANLAKLWAEVDKADRAAQAQTTLKEKYPTSVWAQK